MRSLKSLSVLGFVLLACMSFVVVGCGSDDAPTNTVGSLTDPNLMAVQEQVEALADSTIAFVLSGMQSSSAVSADGDIIPFLYSPGFTLGDQITITYVNGWHIVDLSQTTADYVFNVLDSVQFYNNDAVSQLGANADSIWYRHNWSYTATNQQASYTNIEGYAGFDFRALNTEQAVIDGVNELNVVNQVVTDQSTVVRTFDFASTVTNLAVNKTGVGWAQGCPNGGTINTTVSMSTVVDDGTAIPSIWDVSMTFTDGTAAVTVSTGSTVWSYSTDLCISVN